MAEDIIFLAQWTKQWLEQIKLLLAFIEEIFRPLPISHFWKPWLYETTYRFCFGSFIDSQHHWHWNLQGYTLIISRCMPYFARYTLHAYRIAVMPFPEKYTWKKFVHRRKKIIFVHQTVGKIWHLKMIFLNSCSIWSWLCLGCKYGFLYKFWKCGK